MSQICRFSGAWGFCPRSARHEHESTTTQISGPGPQIRGWGPAGFTPAGAGENPPKRPYAARGTRAGFTPAGAGENPPKTEVGPRWIQSSGRGENPATAVGRNHRGGTDGSAIGAEPRASCRAQRRASAGIPLRSANKTARSGRLGRAASTMSADRSESEKSEPARPSGA